MAGRRATLFQIALMILLAYVERAGRGYLRGDRLAELAAGLQCSFRFFRGRLLLWRMEEDRGAVLRAEVRALAVHLRRVVHLPESVKQLLIGQRRWIESNLHDFGMPGFIGADIFIRGIFSVAAAVPDDGVNNSRNAAECCFDPPKASCSKGRGFGHGTAPLVRLILPGLRTLFDAATSPRDS